MILELIEAPTQEPISLEEALAHLRLGSGEDAVQVSSYLRAAREQVAARTGLCLAPAQYRLSLPHWLPEEYTELPKAPLLRVDSVRYLPQTHSGPVTEDSYLQLPASYWRVDPLGPHGQPQLWRAPLGALPPLYPHARAVQVDFASGPAEGRLHGALRIAILMLLRDLYDGNTEPNAALESLLTSHRASGFAG